mmetsp:Transcript_42287/g.57517  ORF Transcript_42287/g.57517 Transcript_42287/m.57517 type:complete len:123 (+) Transcript_42287:611-979(+)
MVSILFFIVLCGPILCYVYYKNRPRPTEDGKKLVKNLNKIKLSKLKRLRNEMNYKHGSTIQMGANGIEQQESLLSTDNRASEIDMMCCICMENFVNESDTAVILPCKSHFFHSDCIESWIKK